MGVKILENSSFGILRTNPKITGNVKVVVDSSDNIFIESIDANSELSKSKYKAYKTSSSSGYQYDVAKVFGNTPSDIFYDVKKPGSDYTVLDNYGAQYDLDYCYGAYSVNSKSYKEEFGIFSPVWLENNLPDYFIIFKIDGPVTVNSKDATTENQYASMLDDPANFKDLFLSKAKIIKTFNLTENTNIGKYIRNYKNSSNFPISALTFSTRQDQPTYWNGVNVNKPGGFVNMAENIYNTLFTIDRTVLENDFFLTTGFERNRLTCANVLNLEFLFDDAEANPLEINRYFGFFVNAEQEGTFRIDPVKAYLRSKSDNQTTPATSETFSNKNEKSYTVTGSNGVKLYIDSDFTTSVYNIPEDSELTNNSFLPSFSDVSALNSVFFVKDRNGNFHNLNYSKSWLSDEVRLADTNIDVSLFSGYEESILTTRALFADKPSKASTVITINDEIAEGDSYIVALPKKQDYIIEVIEANAGDQITIESGSYNFSLNLSSSNHYDILDDIKNQWDLETDPVFLKYKLSIRNNKLIVSETIYTCVDDNFTITSNSTSTNINITKNVSADLALNTIYASSSVATISGEAVQLFFNPTGTTAEIAKSMAAAINNIKESLFEAVSVDNRVVIIAKVAGPRFNNLVVGRDIFFTSSDSQLITHSPAFNTSTHVFYYFLGGTSNVKSKAIVEIDLFQTFSVPNRYLRTSSNKNSNETLAKVKEVFYYTDGEIRDVNGKLTGFLNFDKYCIVSIDDKFEIFRDSGQSIYLYELYDVPFGRFSFFPVKEPDFNFLSTEYGDIKELSVEKKYYSNFLDSNFINQHEDIKNFYTNSGFTSLLGTLQSQSDIFKNSTDINININSEYDRLRENSQVTISVPSRTVPYINKWVYRNGKNVRETDYRLSTSSAFGLTNFSPASDEIFKNPVYFTHEWYYLQSLPKYYGVYEPSELNKVFSYFPEKIDTTLSGLRSITSDYFTEYFTVNYQKYPLLDDPITGDSYSQPFILNDEKIYEVKKQFRYSLFEGGSSSNFASTLFRGIKVIIKERVENETLINYNLPEIKLKNSSRYNDYKFSTVLIPHNGTYDNKSRKTIEYEFLENRKHKAITFLIYIKVDDILTETKYNNGEILGLLDVTDYIDRTTLYALDSKLDDFSSSTYSNIILSGAIDVRSNVSGTGKLKGIPSSNGQETLFTEEILINKNGSYNQIIAAPLNSVPPTTFYTLENVQDNIFINISSGNLYSGTISLLNIQKGTYTYLEGGYKFWTSRLNKVSFAYIQNLINNGDPVITYTTILEDGTSQSGLFTVELQSASYTMSSDYLYPEQVENKSNVINDLTTLIGDKLVLNPNTAVIPIYRHSGYYQPKFVDVVPFKDPYIATETDERTLLIKNNMADKNTEFMTTIGYSDQPDTVTDFGYIKNFYYHKSNDINPSGIIKLSLQSSELPVYPITGETAIDKKDFYVFKTNWDASYFKRSIDKKSTEDLAGTRSIIEKRSFIGSKSMKIYDAINIETFNSLRVNSRDELESISTEINRPGNTIEIVYYETANNITIDVYLEKRITRYLSESGIYDYFSKYINPKYSFGTQDGITDDVTGYIVSNILPRYLLTDINLYVLKSGKVDLNQTYPVIDSVLTDFEKIKAGFKTDKNVQVLQLGNLSNFNQRLIYNKTAGFNYSFAPSFTLNKK
jgi:hypothetical protein